MYESFEDCVNRECDEECGIKVKDIQFLTARSKPYPQFNKHYVSVIMLAKHASGQPTIPDEEKTKAEDLGWHPLVKLPQPLFETHDIFSDLTLLNQIVDYIGGVRWKLPKETNWETVELATSMLRGMRGI
jgi:ADP-ribose pyrophosphatase YjhB (NUDIX family)